MLVFDSLGLSRRSKDSTRSNCSEDRRDNMESCCRKLARQLDEFSKYDHTTLALGLKELRCGSNAWAEWFMPKTASNKTTCMSCNKPGSFVHCTEATLFVPDQHCIQTRP